MKTSRCLLLLLFIPLHLSSQNPLSYVNPFIGTGGHGHTYPGATAPFGMVQLSPDTRIDMMDWDGCSGYHYSDSTIYGFSHTHLSGTGVSDYGDILFMPSIGGALLEPEEYASPFKKSREKAEAGYYTVFLERDRILCEMTATDRVGVHKYSFPLNQEKGALLIDLRHRDEVIESQLTIVNDQEIAGYRISKSWAQEQHVYFVARFNKPFFSSIALDMAKNPREAAPTVNSKAIVGLLGFYNEQTPLVVTVGISGTSMEGARRNLEAECPDFDFEKVKAATQEKWRKQLAKIEVEGGSTDQKTIFYTALYHTMIAPNLWSDVDGSYRGRDNRIHANPGHEMYTVFSLWDTHRALHPLHTILEPKRTGHFIQTFLRQYEQSGLLPVWELAANETNCMIGYHSIPVIADAYAKGIRDFDLSPALEAMEKTMQQNRPDLEAYRRFGYIQSFQSPESVSKTLEYAYDDWCIAQLAKAAGKTDLYQTAIRRAQQYQNLFDPSTHFFRAKKNAGWYAPFDPYEVNFNYTEANAWQYRFSAQQDMSGLIGLMGGPEQFENQLDSLFATTSKTTGRNQADITGLIGQYVHGNEPSHHIGYLYNYVGKPWKTQQRIRQIMDEQYANRPDGLSGNEDCGQMSAWYVLSAMGFYPVLPGSDGYIIGTPLFEKVTLHLDNGRSFVVQAPGVSAQKRFIKSAVLNGNDYPKTWFTHADLTNGGRLTFNMSNQASDWGAALNDRPVSFIAEDRITPAPFVAQGERTFRNRQVIALSSIDPEATIFYSVGDQVLPMEDNPYKKPFELKESATIVFQSVKNGAASPIQQAVFHKIPDKRRVFRYNTPYSPQYTGGGDECLIDGIRGGNDFRTGGWQGFEGVPLDVVIDLGKKQKINRLLVRFLQDENAWIFFPTKVQFEISDDGEHFRPAGEVVCNIPQTEKGVLQNDFQVSLSGTKARYVRVVGVSLGQCPAWHKGAGYPCWIFADEIVVE